mmetsp:Transcript_11346/g.45796  ORF Transcript_11346/g.45796 Transcript_11346/m.45796 type:complete len:146 (-) Transcript_11346:550-987(-)
MKSNFSASNAVMTSIPSPGTLGPTTETTAGSRYRENRSSRSVDEKGTSLLGFRMTLLPAATAPATMEIVNKKRVIKWTNHENGSVRFILNPLRAWKRQQRMFGDSLRRGPESEVFNQFTQLTLNKEYIVVQRLANRTAQVFPNCI